MARATVPKFYCHPFKKAHPSYPFQNNSQRFERLLAIRSTKHKTLFVHKKKSSGVPKDYSAHCLATKLEYVFECNKRKVNL